MRSMAVPEAAAKRKLPQSGHDFISSPRATKRLAKLPDHQPTLEPFVTHDLPSAFSDEATAVTVEETNQYARRAQEATVHEPGHNFQDASSLIDTDSAEYGLMPDSTAFPSNEHTVDAPMIITTHDVPGNGSLHQKQEITLSSLEMEYSSLDSKSSVDESQLLHTPSADYCTGPSTISGFVSSSATSPKATQDTCFGAVGTLNPIFTCGFEILINMILDRGPTVHLDWCFENPIGC